MFYSLFTAPQSTPAPAAGLFGSASTAVPSSGFFSTKPAPGSALLNVKPDASGSSGLLGAKSTASAVPKQPSATAIQPQVVKQAAPVTIETVQKVAPASSAKPAIESKTFVKPKPGEILVAIFESMKKFSYFESSEVQF